YFHLFNVRRIRPAEMWPYDYHAEQYTPLLWWSEGVTDYYSDLTNIRSGLWTADQFLSNAGQDMQQVESAPEPWSEEDGSVATWIKEVFVNSSQLYYPKGALTGMLLDISMRGGTDDRHSLDDVMRKIGEVELRSEEDWAVKFRQRYRGRAGAPLAIAVQRAAQPLTLTTQVRERTAVSYSLKLLPSPSPKQAEIWRGLTAGSTGN